MVVASKILYQLDSNKDKIIFIQEFQLKKSKVNFNDLSDRESLEKNIELLIKEVITQYENDTNNPHFETHISQI